MKIYAILLASCLIGAGCHAEVVRNGDVAPGSKIAVIAFQDCLIADQDDCRGSGATASAVFARVFSGCFGHDGAGVRAIPITRPVAADVQLTDELAVAVARQRRFAYVLTGEVTDYYNVASFTFRSDRAGVSVRLISTKTAEIVAFYSDRGETRNTKTPDDVLETLAEHMCSAL